MNDHQITMVGKCPECQNLIAFEWDFCPNCGEDISIKEDLEKS